MTSILAVLAIIDLILLGLAFTLEVSLKFTEYRFANKIHRKYKNEKLVIHYEDGLIHYAFD